MIRETRVQGKGAAPAIVAALTALAAHPEVDVVVLARGGGSFEDLLPFSDESVVRAVAASRVPVVSAVGHEQDTPLCDLAADARAATPTAAGALVVPDLAELVSALDASRRRLGLAVRAQLERDRVGSHDKASGSARRRGSCSSGGAQRSITPVRDFRRSHRSRRSDAATRSCARAETPCEARPRCRPATASTSSSPPARSVRPWRGAHVSEPKTFEELQRELEEIVTRLERGDVAVDDAIALFRRGEELYKECVARLQGAELRIEELVSADPGDVTRGTPFVYESPHVQADSSASP